MKYAIQLMWHVNNECNLNCTHCYICKMSCQGVDRWATQERVISRVKELLADYHIVRVGLLGGEPTLDPNLAKIVKNLRKAGVGRVDMSTNGILINHEYASQLKDAGMQMVQVSLEGPNADINDRIRGHGSFGRALNALRVLRKAGLETGIMSTIARFNLPYIADIVRLGQSEGVKIVSFNRMLPLGTGSEHKQDCLQPEELKNMIFKIHELNEAGLGLDVSSDDPLLYVPINGRTYTSNAWGGCGAGIGNLAICHDGTVYPCRRLPINIGNVLEQTFMKIINSSHLDCFYDRSMLKGKCNSCDFRQTCGGCRGASLAFSNDSLAEDPQCWLS